MADADKIQVEEDNYAFLKDRHPEYNRSLEVSNVQ